MTRKILILTSPNNQYAKDLQKSLSTRYDIQRLEIAHQRDFPHELLGTEHFDLIITFDLVGFEQTTLMDGILYNLVSSKFLNFMLRKNLANEKNLSRQLSLSMFFYCRWADYGKYLRGEYPEIPYLKVIPEDKFSEDAAGAMTAAVEEVLAECHLK